jgi:Fe-S cluster biogenesis protein NfuA
MDGHTLGTSGKDPHADRHRSLSASATAVLDAIERIRRAQSDGGDIVFRSLDDRMGPHEPRRGCGTCPVSTQTLKAGVERIIMDRVPGITAVVDDAFGE